MIKDTPFSSQSGAARISLPQVERRNNNGLDRRSFVLLPGCCLRKAAACSRPPERIPGKCKMGGPSGGLRAHIFFSLTFTGADGIKVLNLFEVVTFLYPTIPVVISE
jgi:hypothetical protein